MGDNDDPFDVFGSDSEDEGEASEGIIHETTRIAKSLVDQANNKEKSTLITTSAKIEQEGDNKDDYVDLSYLKVLKLPTWPSPIYQGAVGLFQELPFGGGRGFCALERLTPGTVILVENPVMEWTEEQIGKELNIFAVRCLLLHPNAHQIVPWIEEFHPSKRAVDDENSDENDVQISKMIKDLKSLYSEAEVSDLVQLAESRKIVNSNQLSLIARDVFRILLAIRYNGLESGIYLYGAMLNHSCHPNCAKLLPQGNQMYSEVVTTREVRAGESLTISYVPYIMSHASRRRYLYNQHRFDISASLKGLDLKMELVKGNFPPSSIDHVDEESLTFRIEKSAQDLERLQLELAASVKENQDSIPAGVWETIKELEQSCLELYTESTRQLENENHILLIPCLSTHLETCVLVQQAPGLSLVVQLGILSRQVLSAYRLIHLQKSFLGPHHFDLGRTHLDLANAIGELLSRSPKHLTGLDITPSKSFEDWSKTEHASRSEYKRIKTLYAKNAESILSDPNFD